MDFKRKTWKNALGRSLVVTVVCAFLGLSLVNAWSGGSLVRPVSATSVLGSYHFDNQDSSYWFNPNTAHDFWMNLQDGKGVQQYFAVAYENATGSDHYGVGIAVFSANNNTGQAVSYYSGVDIVSSVLVGVGESCGVSGSGGYVTTTVVAQLNETALVAHLFLVGSNATYTGGSATNLVVWDLALVLNLDVQEKVPVGAVADAVSCGKVGSTSPVVAVMNSITSVSCTVSFASQFAGDYPVCAFTYDSVGEGYNTVFAFANNAGPLANGEGSLQWNGVMTLYGDLYPTGGFSTPYGIDYIESGFGSLASAGVDVIAWVADYGSGGASTTSYSGGTWMWTPQASPVFVEGAVNDVNSYYLLGMDSPNVGGIGESQDYTNFMCTNVVETQSSTGYCNGDVAATVEPNTSPANSGYIWGNIVGDVFSSGSANFEDDHFITVYGSQSGGVTDLTPQFSYAGGSVTMDGVWQVGLWYAYQEQAQVVTYENTNGGTSLNNYWVSSVYSNGLLTLEYPFVVYPFGVIEVGNGYSNIVLYPNGAALVSPQWSFCQSGGESAVQGGNVVACAGANSNPNNLTATSSVDYTESGIVLLLIPLMLILLPAILLAIGLRSSGAGGVGAVFGAGVGIVLGAVTGFLPGWTVVVVLVGFAVMFYRVVM